MISRSPKSISLLITDVDNTLYDWFEIWYASFSALLAGIAHISGIPAVELEPEIRSVHQRHGTSEYAFLIQELPSLQKLHSGADLVKLYRPAIDAARDARKSALRLYPGVFDTLQLIKDRGTRIAAYTESQGFYTESRLRTLGLDGILDFLYTSPDHDLPVGVDLESVRSKPADQYGLRFTEHRNTPKGVLKPNPLVLRTIIGELGDGGGVLYIGDSLMKDISMAQGVGIHEAYAAYGVAHHHPGYELLQRVSHWTDADVEREKEIMHQNDVAPSIVLHCGLAEISDYFDFIPNGR